MNINSIYKSIFENLNKKINTENQQLYSLKWTVEDLKIINEQGNFKFKISQIENVRILKDDYNKGSKYLTLNFQTNVIFDITIELSIEQCKIISVSKINEKLIKFDYQDDDVEINNKHREIIKKEFNEIVNQIKYELIDYSFKIENLKNYSIPLEKYIKINDELKYLCDNSLVKLVQNISIFINGNLSTNPNDELSYNQAINILKVLTNSLEDDNQFIKNVIKIKANNDDMLNIIISNTKLIALDIDSIITHLDIMTSNSNNWELNSYQTKSFEISLENLLEKIKKVFFKIKAQIEQLNSIIELN